MKYVSLIISLVFLLIPLQCLAQSKNTKDVSYYYNYIQNKKLGTRIRVKLKNGENRIGYLTTKYNDLFEIVNEGDHYTIYYSNIADINSGYSNKEKLKFAVLLPYKTVVTTGFIFVYIVALAIYGS